MIKNAIRGVLEPRKALSDQTNTWGAMHPVVIDKPHPSSLKEKAFSTTQGESTLPVNEIEKHLEGLETESIGKELQASVEEIFSNA